MYLCSCKNFYLCAYITVLTCRANHGSILNNPTYELDNGNQTTAASNTQPAKANMNSNYLLTRLERNRKDAIEVYEEVEEPINEEEHNLEVQQSHALPYAVHAYLGEVPPNGTPKPIVPKKSNDTLLSIGGGSDEHSIKIKPQIPRKQAMINPAHGVKLQLDDHRNYSELNMKTRYAYLEPHTGEGTAATRGDATMGESYNYLNH